MTLRRPNVIITVLSKSTVFFGLIIRGVRRKDAHKVIRYKVIRYKDIKFLRPPP